MDVISFMKLVISKNIRFIPHHKCAICGYYTGYYLNILPGNDVAAEYSSACDCGWSPDRPVPLEEAANWFENLSDYERNTIFESFNGGENVDEKYMTAEEKGYECPSLDDCTQCEFYKDLCIIYGKTGKKNAEKWRKKQLITVKNQ